MEYGTYYYHGSSRITRPNSNSYNIKGLELEISSTNEHYENTDLHDKLDEMIENGILSVPNHFGDNAPTTIALEEDGSVFKELILKACGKNKLMETLTILEEELGDLVNNNSNSSCHIHLNNRYLYAKGLDSFDIFLAGEWLGPILYRISGRDEMNIRWAKSYIGGLQEYNLLKRSRLIDEIDTEDVEYEYYEDPHDLRYYLVNLRLDSPTTELRIFSNKYNFNKDIIRLYIDCADLVIDIAEIMINKSYQENYNELIEITKKFFTKRNNKKYFEKFKLEKFFVSEEELKRIELEEEKEKIIAKIKEAKERFKIDQIDSYIRLLRILRNYNSRFDLPRIKLTLNSFNEFNKVEEILVNQINTELENL